MANGFDCKSNAQHAAATFASQGYTFAGRYLSRTNVSKQITTSEAAALKAAGLKVVLIYEDDPTLDTYFLNGRGSKDAFYAIEHARLLGAQTGAAIYFAVDYDATLATANDPIIAYFTEVATVLANAEANPEGYTVGVYGSGLVCQTIVQNGLARYTWLAQSMGWQDSRHYAAWTIRQGPTNNTNHSLSFDPDTTSSDEFGAM